MSRRIGITTTADGAGPLCEAAIEHELTPIILPCIEVTPAPEDTLRQAAKQAEQADWLVVTSARAIAVLWPDGGMPDTPVAAVGPATAEVAVQAGGSVAMVGETGAAALVEELAGNLSDRIVFFPHASGASPATVPALEESGARVFAAAVYTTRPVGPGSDPVDAVMFGSPSAVSGWSQTRSFEDLVIGVIGETTAGAVLELGHRPDLVSPRPDFDLLIALVAQFLSDRSPV